MILSWSIGLPEASPLLLWILQQIPQRFQHLNLGVLVIEKPAHQAVIENVTFVVDLYPVVAPSSACKYAPGMSLKNWSIKAGARN